MMADFLTSFKKATHLFGRSGQHLYQEVTDKHAMCLTSLFLSLVMNWHRKAGYHFHEHFQTHQWHTMCVLHNKSPQHTLCIMYVYPGGNVIPSEHLFRKRLNKIACTYLCKPVWRLKGVCVNRLSLSRTYGYLNVLTAWRWPWCLLINSKANNNSNSMLSSLLSWCLRFLLWYCLSIKMKIQVLYWC